MTNETYEDFLRLTGFEEEEIPRYLPEWRKASEKLGLTEEDIRFSTREWLPAYHQVDLKGIRKALGCFVREAIDLTKANEYKKNGVKIVYGILPATVFQYYALKLAAPDKVYVSFPDAFLAIILNSFFHKLNPFLEEAENSGIPHGCRHCALNKTRYTARKRGLLPSPDVSWIWGFVCDEGPKTDEFIQLHCDPNWNTYVSRIPHDQPLGTIEDEVDDYVEYLADQMRDGFEFVQKQTGITVSDEKLLEVSDFWQRYNLKMAELSRLMAADPPPLGGVASRILAQPLSIPFNTGMEGMEQAMDITIEELQRKVSKKEGLLPEGAPRLMASTIPFVLPWIPEMFRQNGVGLIFHSAAVPSRKELKPPRFKDPYMIAAESWLKRSYYVNAGYKADLYCEKLETVKADGMIFGLNDFDRWLGSDHRLTYRIVQEKTDLPLFYIEGDIWEDRDYSPEALRTRIESICEVVKMRKSG